MTEPQKRVVRRFVSDFPRNLKEFDTEKLVADFQVDLHRETMRLHKAHRGPLSELVNCRDFVIALYATLVAWGMGRRSVQLVDLDEFAEGLKRIAEMREFARLSRRSLARLGGDSEQVAGDIWRLIETLKPTRSKSQLVAGTKVLHHIFPKLVPPVDRTYTRAFFHVSFSNPKRHEAAFVRVFCCFADAAHRVCKSQRAFRAVRKRLGKRMHTSLPKMLDNALIGDFHRHQKGES